MSEHSSTEIMIEAQGLSKYYGDFIAVENLDFTIREGEVVAFLGPNGAGKSTTMKMLTGTLHRLMEPRWFAVWKSPKTGTKWQTVLATFLKMVPFMRK